jgi:CspA family cold shock protein
MRTGTVKWFIPRKGFAFITPDAGGKDLFAHFSQIEGEGRMTLQDNQKVSFEVTIGPNGGRLRTSSRSIGRLRAAKEAGNRASSFFRQRTIRSPGRQTDAIARPECRVVFVEVCRNGNQGLRPTLRFWSAPRAVAAAGPC